MALNHLTVSEMVSLTEDWVVPTSPLYIALIALPGMDAVIPHVVTAHQGLLDNQNATHVQSAEELKNAATAKDAVHDDFARAAYKNLESHLSMALALNDEVGIERYKSLLTVLFPDDLSVVKYSYREEAGYSTLLQSRMDVKIEQQLAAIPMQGRSLLDVVRAWIQAGQELGTLENQRAETAGPTRRVNVSPMRFQWMRAITAVRTMLDLIDSVLPPLVVDALVRIQAAALAAERANRTSTPAEPAPSSDAPSDSPSESPSDSNDPTPTV